MFDEYAEVLANQAYPHFADPKDRALIVATMAEDIKTGFQKAFRDSLTDEQRDILSHLAETDDPRLDAYLDSLGFNAIWDRFSRDYAAEHVDVDGSGSLIPEKDSYILSTVRLRDPDESGAAKRPPAPWPSHPEPAPPSTPAITVNLGRRKAPES